MVVIPERQIILNIILLKDLKTKCKMNSNITFYRQILKETKKIGLPDVESFICRRTKEMFLQQVKPSHTPEEGLAMIKRYTSVCKHYIDPNVK